MSKSASQPPKPSPVVLSTLPLAKRLPLTPNKNTTAHKPLLPALNPPTLTAQNPLNLCSQQEYSQPEREAESLVVNTGWALIALMAAGYQRIDPKPIHAGGYSWNPYWNMCREAYTHVAQIEYASRQCFWCIFECVVF